MKRKRMKSGYQIVLELPLLGEVQCKIADKFLFDFTKRQFYCYIKKETLISNINKNEIEIEIKNTKYIEEVKKIDTNTVGLSRKFKLEKDIIFYKGFKYILGEDSLNIQTSSSAMSIFQQIIKTYKGFFELEKYAYYHMQFYQLILFPIFTMYTLMDGYYCVHGSLLSVEDKVIIIGGLDGVGKSSLCNCLGSEINNKILADNFVLFNGRKAIPLMMPIRLKPDQETDGQVLYSNKSLKEVSILSKENMPKEVTCIFNLSIGSTIKCSESDFNETLWSQFCNNAVEIGMANQFMSPFLYFIRGARHNDNMKFYFLEIPMGKIHEGVKVILNECKIFD